MRFKYLAPALVFFITGCANSAQVQQYQARFNSTIPTCSDEVEQQCDKMWEAAQVWVARNSAYKLQIATNVLLETYNPQQNSTAIAVKVVKEPASSSSYRFVVSVYCGNIFGCNPNAWEAAIAFNMALLDVKS